MVDRVADRLGRRLAQDVVSLKSDIAQRGREAAVDFARSRLRNVPRKGAFDSLSDAYLDALFRLDLLTEDHLLCALREERSHERTREWIVKNAREGSEAISSCMARLARGEQFLQKRRGPKFRADDVFQSAVKAVAASLIEAGVPRYANEGNTHFTAAEVISEALGMEDGLPISPSLVRDWIR